MKKCKFCEHIGRTEKGESVCTKKMVCLEDLEEFPCSDLEITIDTKHALFFFLIAVLLVFTIMVSQI